MSNKIITIQDVPVDIEVDVDIDIDDISEQLDDYIAENSDRILDDLGPEAFFNYLEEKALTFEQVDRIREILETATITTGSMNHWIN
jgi:small-conductance mechanosensitive channel